MNIETKLILEGKTFEVFDVNSWFKKFFKKLSEDRKAAVFAYLNLLADGSIGYKPKCFSVLEEKICELKPKGTNNQVRIFVYRKNDRLYLLGGLIKKTDVQKREQDFYKTIAKRQKDIRRYLDG